MNHPQIVNLNKYVKQDLLLCLSLLTVLISGLVALSYFDKTNNWVGTLAGRLYHFMLQN
jgi:hypothetical protein